TERSGGRDLNLEPGPRTSQSVLTLPGAYTPREVPEDIGRCGASPSGQPSRNLDPSGTRHVTTPPLANCYRSVLVDLRRRLRLRCRLGLGLGRVELLGQPGEEGVDLGGAVAADRGREPDRAEVL